jgi:hypothetical protein
VPDDLGPDAVEKVKTSYDKLGLNLNRPINGFLHVGRGHAVVTRLFQKLSRREQVRFVAYD